MFYSHEILTSRKYGVATVWLVATLGAKSSLKKVTRKAILDVDVPKACKTILTPEAPLALRLQSNLLYGVSRVYSQQCGYVLQDAQSTQSNIKALLKIVRTAQLDPDAGKARPDQLMLPDDPAYLPDLEAYAGLDVDLSALEISSDAISRRSSLPSQRSVQSSRSSLFEAEGALPGLVVPTSDTGIMSDVRGFALPGDDGALVQPSDRIAAGLFEGPEEGFLRDVDFEFDAEGNVIELDAAERARRQSAAVVGVSRLSRDSGVSSRVRREHDEGMEAMAQLALERPEDDDMGMAGLSDDYNLPLPAAEPFPEMQPAAAAGAGLPRSSPEAEEEPISEAAGAPLRRRARAAKVIEADEVQELRNADLAEWNNNYLANMGNIARSKQHYRANAQAKKNAAFWVMGAGIGNVGSGVGTSRIGNPLAVFAGENLLEKLTGAQTTTASRKRSRSVSGEADVPGSEERRVRAREDDGDQIGRGEELALEDIERMPAYEEEGTELGRGAPTALEDISSQMPWNITASAHGSRLASSVARGRGLPSVSGFPTSAGGPSSAARALEGRTSRLTSASPLIGRGRERLSSLELPGRGDEEEGEEEGYLGGPYVSEDMPVSEAYQLPGPAPLVDPQVRDALDQDSANFLEFVKAELGAMPPPEDGGEEGDGEGFPPSRPFVEFEELLPPRRHTKAVAAQALHHVLALATASLLHVRQDEGYGPIFLSVVERV